jgi:hypothetical protein
VARADWVQWHELYADPESLQSRRLPIVQAHIRACLDSRAAEDLRVISLCAGEGRDLLDVLETSPQLGRVSALLVELNPQLVARARERVARLPRVEVVEGDAGVTDAYEGFAPADLVLACGVFGNVPDDDVENTVRALRQLCAEGGTVIWTRHRRSPDLTPSIRRWFAEAGFREQAFDSPGSGSFAVGVHRSARPPLPLVRGRRLFIFAV